jgi:hypothetical protein
MGRIQTGYHILDDSLDAAAVDQSGMTGLTDLQAADCARQRCRRAVIYQDPTVWYRVGTVIFASGSSPMASVAEPRIAQQEPVDAESRLTLPGSVLDRQGASRLQIAVSAQDVVPSCSISLAFPKAGLVSMAPRHAPSLRSLRCTVLILPSRW